jgi:dUTP pyrophosphatase
MMEVKILLLEHFDKNYSLPSYETTHAAGADVRCMLPNQDKLTIAPGQRVLIPTGMCFEIPLGYEIQVRPRSGLSLKSDLLVVNSPGTIDADYRGEIKIIMGNFGKDHIHIVHGDRIAQLVLAPVIQAQFLKCDQLGNTKRSSGGFGSTGMN